jgi:hypothetical protein
MGEIPTYTQLRLLLCGTGPKMLNIWCGHTWSLIDGKPSIDLPEELIAQSA